MPYTMASLPDNVKRLSEQKQRQWLSVWNSAFSRCEKDGEGDCEASAFRQANGVVFSVGEPADRARLATFTLPAVAEPSGDFVLRQGKIFEAGDYPDHAFTITPEELRETVAAFQPVPLVLDHLATRHGITTVFDGKLGELRAVELGPDGQSLLGTVALPRWLDEVLGAGERKVSVEIDRQTRQLTALGLTTNPAIPDAALLSAYATFAGRRHSSADLKDLQAIHDLAVAQGAECTATMSREDAGEKGRTQMGFKDAVARWFSAGMPDDFDPAVDDAGKAALSDPKTPASQGDDALKASFAQELAARDSRIAALEAERRQNAAATFADSLVTAKKALPAEKPAIVAAFVRAAEDDAVHPATVTLGEGKSGGRVDALKALYDARPAHILTAETLPPDLNVEQVIAAFAAPKDQTTLTEERRRQLLAASPLGQAVLNAQNAQNGKGG